MGEVFVYNPYEAGWLDHQRLRVPKWRNWIEFANFAILLGLFIATLACESALSQLAAPCISPLARLRA